MIQDLRNSLANVQTPKDVNVREVMNLLRFYQPLESEWRQYALRDKNKCYTRNLVSQLTPNASLLVLVWDPLKGSGIHDHPESNCFMKILKGDITEKLFFQNDEKDLELIRSTTIPTNAVGYINDKIGIHSMQNETNGEVVSLHLYVPSYEQSTTFSADHNKGTTTSVIEFYSIAGKVVDEV